MLIDQIKDDEIEEDVKPKLFNSSAKFGSMKTAVIDSEKVLSAAKEIFNKQKENPVQHPNDAEDYESSSESEDEMSFTSDENENDKIALLQLITGKKLDTQKSSYKPEKTKIVVDSDLSAFKT